MKKSNRFILIFAMLIACLSVFFCIGQYQVKAADFSINNNNKDEYHFDSTLFAVVQKMYAQLVGVNVPGFNAYIFSDEFKTVEAPAGSDAEKIKNDLTNGILDLTTGENAKYNCLKNRSDIKDISGLNYMKLDNITTLILDDNALSSIDESDLDSLTNLRTLSIKNNKLNSFKLNPDIKTISTLDLSNNNLKQIDISSLSSYGGDGPKCNLSSNEFSGINDIVYPTAKMSQLNLSFNKLSTLTSEEWTSLNNNIMESGVVADIIIQGIQDFNLLTAGDQVTIYQNNILPNLQMVVLYSEDSLFYDSSSDNTICQNSGTEDIESIFMPAGKVSVEFYSDGYLVNSENFLDEDKQEIVNKLSPKECQISMPTPKISGYSEGKLVNSLSQDKDIKVVIGFDSIENIPNKEDILSNTNGATIFYKQENDKEATNKAEFSVTSNGTYKYFAYITFDGVEGKVAEFTVTRNDMSGIILGIVIIVVIFVVCAAIYFLAKWIRDGANVAPLTDKELFRVNRKRRTSMLYDREKSIRALDNSIDESKAGGANYNSNDDSVSEDLNKYDYSFSGYDIYDDNNEDDKENNLNDSEDNDQDEDFDEERDD